MRTISMVVLLAQLLLCAVFGGSHPTEETICCQDRVEANEWMASLPPGAEITAVKEWQPGDSKRFLIVVFKQEEPRYDVRLRVYDVGGSNAQLVAEFPGLDHLVFLSGRTTDPFLVTAWGGGSGLGVLVFAPADGSVSVVLSKDVTGTPDLVDLDNDGEEELLIPYYKTYEEVYDPERDLSLRFPGRIDVYKWKGDGFTLVDKRSWKDRLRALSEEATKSEE